MKFIDFAIYSLLYIFIGTDVNTIKVTCTKDSITLWVNGQFEYEVPVSDPFEQPGDMALFLYTYEDATSGYKVYFDNVLAEE